MTILIHPTLLRRPQALEMLRRQTGMHDVVGSTAVRLEPRPTRARPVSNIAVILECTHCCYQTNKLLRGETCTRCRKGTMVDPWNGGSAA